MTLAGVCNAKKQGEWKIKQDVENEAGSGSKLAIPGSEVLYQVLAVFIDSLSHGSRAVTKKIAWYDFALVVLAGFARLPFNLSSKLSKFFL